MNASPLIHRVWATRRGRASAAGTAGRLYRIEPGGLVKLGYYGSVAVAGLTVSEAEAAITQHLRTRLKEPVVSATLADFAAKHAAVSITRAG